MLKPWLSLIAGKSYAAFLVPNLSLVMSYLQNYK